MLAVPELTVPATPTLDKLRDISRWRSYIERALAYGEKPPRRVAQTVDCRWRDPARTGVSIVSHSAAVLPFLFGF